MQLGLQEANSAASSCGLQEASRVQHAAGVARSKQGARSSWDSKKQTVQQATGVAESNSGAACSWGCEKQIVQQALVGCRKQLSCNKQLGLQGATRLQ